MKSYTRRTLIIAVIIYTILMLVIYFIYSIYSYDFSVRQTYNLAINYHDSYEKSFDDTLEHDYLTFTSYIDKYDNINQYNNNLLEITLPHLKYDKVYSINNVGINDGNNSYTFYNYYDYNDIYNLNVSIFKLNKVFNNNEDNTLYGVFRYEDYIATFNFDDYLHEVSKSSNVLIMRDNGIIFYSRENISSNKLIDYVDNDTTSLFNDYFSQNKKDAKWITINDQKYIMVFSPILNDSSLFFITIFNPKDLRVAFDSLNLYVLGALLLIALLFIIANIIVFYLVSLKFTDIENARIRFYYNQRLIIRINRYGKIVFKNKSFKNNVLNHKTYKYANDLIKDDSLRVDNIFDDINKLESFSTNLPGKEGTISTNFITLRMGRGYLLVSDNLKGSSLELKEYERLAFINPTTNLPNYNLLIKYLDQIISSKKIETNKYVLIAFNIVDFKNINKLTGKKGADEILNNLVRIIEEHFKKYKFCLYNTYVDRFVMVFENINDLPKLIKTVMDFINYAESTGSLDKTKINLNIRTGLYDISLIMGENVTSKQIYERLMAALLVANESSNNTVVQYDRALRNTLLNKERMEKELIKSIENKEFTLYLQPQFSLIKNKIIGFESLIRWTDEKHQKVTPQELIRLAETNNLIDFIGKTSIEEAISIAKKLENEDVKVAINISPYQILKQGFVYQFETLIKKYNLRANMLAIEITETMLDTSLSVIAGKLKRLQKMGIEIHIDDFGTEYSSLLYLKDLPIDMIKIDKQFIDNITTDRHSKAIVSMIVSLSKTLNISVIAEGVETTAQANELRKLGVKLIQGFLISKAVPVEEAYKLLTENQGGE